jgi:hypothetical protein
MLSFFGKIIFIFRPSLMNNTELKRLNGELIEMFNKGDTIVYQWIEHIKESINSTHIIL